jgi:hypothetical protein
LRPLEKTITAKMIPLKINRNDSSQKNRNSGYCTHSNPQITQVLRIKNHSIPRIHQCGYQSFSEIKFPRYAEIMQSLTDAGVLDREKHEIQYMFLPGNNPMNYNFNEGHHKTNMLGEEGEEFGGKEG